MGFTFRSGCSYEPKSLHVKPNPPCERLFHNASKEHRYITGAPFVFKSVFPFFQLL
ncbi:hypothetical protein HMPREF9374_0614 [Desmospora sp. 8437]|nr:hypothetical protein HMPREF9374_0614 [Desmospora sp. 8437]